MADGTPTSPTLSAPKAIETAYAGCRFRSRLEARWAIVFDTLGVPWQYEPEGFELPSGRYLPDFWLPSIETWFEVKGRSPTDDEWRKLDELQDATGHRAMLAFGDIPFDTDSHGYAPDSAAGMAGPRCIVIPCDFDYAWCICPWCGKPGIEYEARSARICGWATHGITVDQAYEAIANNPNCWRIDDKCYTGDHPRLHAAYNAGRSARFEFGETPQR